MTEVSVSTKATLAELLLHMEKKSWVRRK